MAGTGIPTTTRREKDGGQASLRKDQERKASQRLLSLLGNPTGRVKLILRERVISDPLTKGVVPPMREIGFLEIPPVDDSGEHPMPKGKHYEALGEWRRKDHPVLSVDEKTLKPDDGMKLKVHIENIIALGMSVVGTPDADEATLTIGGTNISSETFLQISQSDTQSSIQINVTRNDNPGDPNSFPYRVIANAQIFRIGNPTITIGKEDYMGRPIGERLEGLTPSSSDNGVNAVSETLNLLMSIFPGDIEEAEDQGLLQLGRAPRPMIAWRTIVDPAMKARFEADSATQPSGQ